MARHGSLLREWTRRDFVARYRRGTFTFLWPLARPALLLAIYGTLFSRALKVQVPGGNYLLYAVAGLVPWIYFSVAISQAAGSLSSAAPIVRKVYFPKAVVPIASAVVTLFDLALLMVAMAVVALTTGTGVPISVLSTVPVIAGFTLLVAAGAVITAVAAALSPNLRQAVPLGLQLLFIATPIVYPPRVIPESMWWVVDLNPIGHVAQTLRDAFFDGSSPSILRGIAWLTLGGFALALAVTYCASVEDRLADTL